MQHAGDLAEFVLPGEASLARDVLQISGIVAPQPGFIGRAHRHRQIAAELDIRTRLTAGPFDQKGADRLGRAPQLIGNTPILLHPRPAKTGPVQFKRQPVSPLKHLQLPSIPGHSLASCLTTGD